jgi:hypothetical protein
MSMSESQPQSQPQSQSHAVDLAHLEQEGERKVAELIKTGNASEQTLLGIINEGNDEFKRVHGRNMSYSEMRSLYG